MAEAYAVRSLAPTPLSSLTSLMTKWDFPVPARPVASKPPLLKKAALAAA